MGNHGETTSRELESGDRLGEYRLEALLGEGGMGLVFKAVGDDGQVVALKVLKRELGEDEVFKAAIRPGGPRCSRGPPSESRPDLSVGRGRRPELPRGPLRGGRIARRPASRYRTLDVDETLALAEQLAAGLDALHAAGLVHRDVKASNVVFDREGSAMLTDFGLAKGRATRF